MPHWPADGVFSQVPTYEWLDDNEFAFAIRDQKPSNRGHVLVVSKRIVPTWFDATHGERLAIIDLIDRVKRMLDGAQPRPQGYDVSFDDGDASVMHLHARVIPRRSDAPSLPVQSPVVASRPLPPAALERAREVVEAILVRSDGVLKQHGGRRVRSLGRALEGGVRIVGPDTGFVECTVSEFEVAWVIATEDEVALHGGSLDAARVERLRELDLTPSHSLRSADTGWAIALVRASR